MDHADAYLRAINASLLEFGLPKYVDPVQPPDVYESGKFGRSALDHHGGVCIIRIAELATACGSCPNLNLLVTNPYRVAFLPTEFSEPIQTEYIERIAGRNERIWVGSAQCLFRELISVADEIGIPLTGERLSDDVAEKINDFAPLYDNDDCSFSEDERTAWLLLYEGSRLAIRHQTALSLAG